jgi:hypothetical protein
MDKKENAIDKKLRKGTSPSHQPKKAKIEKGRENGRIGD